MPRQQAVSVENSFINGLVTEATGLDFPDKAVTETYDCVFDIDGSVYRREGFDFEDNYSTKNVDRTNKAMSIYLWPNVAGNGDVTIAVVQIGNTLHFYETNGTGIFSASAVSSTVTLIPVEGAPAPDKIEAQFCNGNGYLIVTHPYIDPMYISYDTASHAAIPYSVSLKIRDFEGAPLDPYPVDKRPITTLDALNINHLYNLYNQGWTLANLMTWDAAQPMIPSNADVMWRFKDSSDNFDASAASINRVSSGNTPAPKGHFVLNLSYQDRVSAIGAARGSVPVTTTVFQRPSCCAFFAGRVFYAGINYVGFNSNIYFTQIIENNSQYGNCYQVNDPTAENLFDELPSDGGVISIPEAGTIYKMFTVPGGLCIFAANGIWFITGSTGLGFTATDYAVLKIADIPTISASSFVNVAGYPAWWNSEGIYVVAAQGNLPQVKSLTYSTFKSFYDGIPLVSKQYARGFYDKTNNILRWVYRSKATLNTTETYEFDRVLNFNVRTNAFYPWTISDSPVKVNGVISSELITRPVSFNQVVDSNENQVIDSLGDNVYVFSEAASVQQQFDKYLVSYPNGTSSKITFANRRNEDYVDWFGYDNVGVNYESYVITGFKLLGQAIRKFQNNWVEIYSRLESSVAYKFQALWDFAVTGNGTGKWSTDQYITHNKPNYSNTFKRLKVRGHGKVLQFKLSSIDGKPFDIIGWSSFQSSNQQP